MFLEYWMIAVLALAFGLNALYNRKVGIAVGTIATLQRLMEDKVVLIEDGEVVPYRNAWAPKPVRRRKKG
jgi:hypothetical protein